MGSITHWWLASILVQFWTLAVNCEVSVLGNFGYQLDWIKKSLGISGGHLRVWRYPRQLDLVRGWDPDGFVMWWLLWERQSWGGGSRSEASPRGYVASWSLPVYPLSLFLVCHDPGSAYERGAKQNPLRQWVKNSLSFHKLSISGPSVLSFLQLKLHTKAKRFPDSLTARWECHFNLKLGLCDLELSRSPPSFILDWGHSGKCFPIKCL